MYKFSKIIILIFLALSSLSQKVAADDVDILNEDVPIGANILFILDLSGSMNFSLNADRPAGFFERSRLDVVRGAFQDIINDDKYTGLNIGLSLFSGGYQNARGGGVAHGITYPVAQLAGRPAQEVLSQGGFTHPGASYMPPADTMDTRQYLTLFSSDQSIWQAQHGTPIVDALYEAVLYFRGDTVDHGRFAASDVRSAHPSTYTGSLAPAPSAAHSPSYAPDTRPSQAGAVSGTCTEVQDTRVMCEEGVTTCDTGLNCSVEPIEPVTHFCPTSLVSIPGVGSLSCEGHPSWNNCKTEPRTSCAYNANDQMICTKDPANGVDLLCEETSRTFCDRADPLTLYNCDFEVLEDIPSNYNVLGSVKYVSPIKNECAKNAVVFLTDGMPTINNSSDRVKQLTGNGVCAINDYNGDGVDDFSDYQQQAGGCGVELAEYMSSTDHSSSITGDQNISLYTVGLALGATPTNSTRKYLKELAKKGKGAFYSANNRAKLARAFKDAISAVDGKTHSFSAPTYTVNTSTMLTHADNVYVPVFSGKREAAWSGNLKKYKLINGELFGKNSIKATDASGKLDDTVSDLWSSSAVSINAVESGGAASNLNPASRNVLTDNGSALVNINTATASQLGVTSSKRLKLIEYIKGATSDGAPRHHMGDIVHSKPVQLMMGGSDSVVFVGTNEGYLHAIQGSTGKELFAYMPKELLKNIKPQYNSATLGNRLYGVDSPITLFDDNNNGVKEPGEKAAIFFGLRRGGKAYYGLDITDPARPSLKWKFTHPKLGYTWSQPVLSKLMYGGSSTATNVLIFGGGYIDDNHLDTNTPDTDRNARRVAASVFIINAETGALISLIKGPSLKYAVPSKISVLDIDRNGSADRLYFADTGGNVLRVDLDPNKDNSIGDYKLTKLASLGGHSASNKRKFFHTPDVALFKHAGRVVLSVSIGSGTRPNPLGSKVDNYFFMLLDENVFKVPATSQNIRLNRLYSAPLSSSDNLLSELAKPGGKRGWKMAMSQSGLIGEKVLSSSVTFQNNVLFTTFSVDSVAAPINNVACGVGSKYKASLYALDLLSGKAALDLNKDGSVSDNSDSSVLIPNAGILGTPQVVRGGFKSSTGGACSEHDCLRSFEIHAGFGPKVADNNTKMAKPLPVSKTLPRVYWLENDK